MTAKNQPSSFLLYSLVALLTAADVSSFPSLGKPHQAFLVSRSYDSSFFTSKTRLYSDTRGKNGKTKFGQKTDAEVSRFLTEFRTADGNVVDPYQMLQIKRSATNIEIKQSYRRLSKKLHPDMVAQSSVLPGNCANLDEVREEWERVKFSYEILSDPKVRKNYDRNSSVATVLEDPTGAVGRAVIGGAMSGVGMVLGGAWKLGEIATKKVYETATAEREAKPTPNNEASMDMPLPPPVSSKLNGNGNSNTKSRSMPDTITTQKGTLGNQNGNKATSSKTVNTEVTTKKAPTKKNGRTPKTGPAAKFNKKVSGVGMNTVRSTLITPESKA